MNLVLKSTLLACLFALTACGEAKPERVLVDVLQPDLDANYGVFVWRVKNSPYPTTLHFGLAAIGAGDKTNEQILVDLESFGSADFTVSEVAYGWSELKQFSVCAARHKQRALTDTSISATVMNDVKFSSQASCSGAWAQTFPPRLTSPTQE